MTTPDKEGETPVEAPHLHSEVMLRPGFEHDHIAYFPLLADLPVEGGFSWGEGSVNMSERFGGAQARESTQTFLEKLHMPLRAARIAPGVGFKSKDDIMEITDGMVDESDSLVELEVGDNFIYTRSPNVSLMVKPADCPSSIVYAKDRDGRDIVGIGHWGREELISMNPAAAIAHLREGEHCDVKDIKVAISPGIGPEHYVILAENVVFSQEEKDRIEAEFIAAGKETPKLIVLDLERWGKRATFVAGDPKDPNDRGHYLLDIKGRTLDILLEAGVLPGNIEMYDVDTYIAAENGDGFSQRYATATNQPEKNGRFLVAACLRPKESPEEQN